MKPNWYRVNGEKDKPKRPLIIFTLLVLILSSPFLLFWHEKTPEFFCLEEDINNAYKCYWSDSKFIPYLNIYGFVLVYLLYGMCPVILVVVLNIISAVNFLRRYFTKKKKMESQRIESGRGREKAAGNTREDTDIYRKLSGVMISLSLCSLIFVGSWYCLKLGLNVYANYQFYTSGFIPDWYWQKGYEVAELVGHLTTSFNGIVNSLILLMFPVTRKSLITFLRRLFGKTAE